MKYEIKLTHISEIKAGDTVMIDGKMRTVCRNNIKRDFDGLKLFGDSFRLGSKAVEKVVIFRAVAGGKFVTA